MKRGLFIGCILAWAVSATSWAAATEEVDYMAILLDGKKIGHAIHTRTVEGVKVTTTEEMNLLIGRGESAIQYKGKEVSVETNLGKPAAFEMVQTISGMQQVRKGTIRSGKVNMTIQNGPTKQQQQIPYPKGALMAEGMRLLQLKKGFEPGLKYETLIFRPDMDKALPATVEIGNKVKVDLLGRTVELNEVKVTMKIDEQTITVVSFVDEECKALKSIVPMMGMTLEMIDCDKEFALRQDDVVDFLDKLTIASPAPIAKTDLPGPISYELVATTDKPLIIPTTDTQKVEQLAPNRFKVTVQPIAAQEGVAYPSAAVDANLKKYLDPTEYLQSADGKVLDLVKYAVTCPGDASKAVFQIENFVNGYITKKDLSVGYASAAEVAQSRQGDCSEHAVLAATMCRAVGIPSRVVCGIVYADAIGNKKNVFGGHMWSEAYIGDKWIPLDPTRAPKGFSAAHITLAYGNGEPKDFFSMVNTLGCFTIEKITTPAVAKAAEVQPKSTP